MDWINLVSNYGFPAVITIILLQFFVKPLFDSFIKNIEAQTDAQKKHGEASENQSKMMAEVLKSCNETKPRIEKMENNIDSIQTDVHELKSSVNSLKSK